MDMRLFMVEVTVGNAYSKSGIPLDVKAIANVKISNNPAYVRNAVERFLGTNPQQIAVVARQTLEGVLREVLAQLTPEEVNEDRLKFAETLKKHAQDDFDKLGLELDVLKVQHVSDEQQYLQNLGRARIAHDPRRPERGERGQPEDRRGAGLGPPARGVRPERRRPPSSPRGTLRGELAKMEAEAKSIENEAAIAAETARSTAEQESCSGCAASSRS
jgi:flotillin